MARQPQIVRDEFGQMPAQQQRPIALARDELIWRRNLRDAQAANDIPGELNARRMLQSVFQSSAPQQPPAPNPLEQFGSGMAETAAGLAQLLPEAAGGFTPDDEQSFSEGRQLYREGRPEGVDLLNIAGATTAGAPSLLLPSLRAGQAGALMRTAGGVGGGGASGGLLFADSPQERLQNTAIGAAGGGIGGAVVPPLVGAGLTGIRKAIPMRLGAKAQRLKDSAAAFGYTGNAAPTRGRLSGDPSMIGDEANLAKLPGGERLQGRFQEQGAQDLVNLEEFQSRYGGPTDPVAAGGLLEGAVQDRSNAWQRQVGRAYQRAQAERPDASLAGVRLRDATADVLDEFDVPPAVARRINNLSEQADGIAPNDLEKLDKLLTQNQGVNRATDRAMSRLKERVRGVIDEAGEEYGGLYREAVGAAKERFDALGDMRSVANKLERGALDPIKVLPTIKGAGVRELGSLRDFVAEANPEAWQAVRGAVMTDIAEQAMPSGQFSQAAYNRAIKKISPARAKILFGDDAAQELFDFGDVVRDLYGPVRGSTQNFSNTAVASSRMMDSMLTRILRSTPLVGDMADALIEGGARRQNARAAQLALNPSRVVPVGPDRTGLLSGASGLGLLGTQNQERR